MRYDFGDLPITRRPEGDTTLAREKNTSRANARRRTRDTQRAELAAQQAEAQALAGSAVTTEEAPPERKPLFQLPSFREDLRLLPEILRTKRLVYLPLVLLLVGLAIWVAGNTLSPDVASIASYYIQFFWLPPALFTFFLAGFWVPRGAYYVGLIYGVIAGVIWSIGFYVNPPDPANPTPLPTLLASTILYGALYGTLAAALASWYRGFLQQMSERGRERRAQRENDERMKRAAQRQEARKLAKQRPT